MIVMLSNQVILFGGPLNFFTQFRNKQWLLLVTIIEGLRVSNKNDAGSTTPGSSRPWNT
jgi:hypothetical protein